MKEMIHNLRSPWLWNKFSLSEPYEMYREQYGEYAYWCQGVEGYGGYCFYIFNKESYEVFSLTRIEPS